MKETILTIIIFEIIVIAALLLLSRKNMRKKTEKKLKIIYNAPEGNNEKLDNALKKIVKKFGWKFEGGGYDFRTSKRDLSFKV